MLSSTQWQKIEDKYGSLIHLICHKISGDNAICSHDDNLQDLRITALEAVLGFEKQNDGANGKFDDFWGTKGFDQYIKTCLWTKKNNKGAKITKKYPITKGTVSTDKEEVLNIADSSASVQTPLMIEDFSSLLDDKQKKVINLVVSDPSLIKANGRFNIRRISAKLDMTMFKTKTVVEGISLRLGN